jgi:hypothetical protein
VERLLTRVFMSEKECEEFWRRKVILTVTWGSRSSDCQLSVLSEKVTFGSRLLEINRSSLSFFSFISFSYRTYSPERELVFSALEIPRHLTSPAIGV